jgi:hypothetical protein
LTPAQRVHLDDPPCSEENPVATPAQETQPRAAATPRGFRAVWPGLGLILMVVTVAYLAVPSVRHQLELSMSRQDTPFVELYAVMLDSQSHAGTTCQPAGAPGSTQVTFAMRSHLRDRDTLHYQVAVSIPPAADQPDSTPGTPYKQRIFDRVNVDPGATRSVQLDVPVPPDQPFDIAVTLPATAQSLLFHCAAQAAA